MFVLGRTYKVAPCKGCLDRKDLCHSTCEEYLNWKRMMAELKEKEKLEKIAHYPPDKWERPSSIERTKKKNESDNWIY